MTTPQTQHQIFTEQLAGDLRTVTEIQTEVTEQIEAATLRALDCILTGNELGGSATQLAAGRVAMNYISRAAQNAGGIAGCAANLRLPLRKSANITPAVHTGVADQMQRACKLRDEIEDLLVKADKKMDAA